MSSQQDAGDVQNVENACQNARQNARQNDI
jgi:hypothetical protein